MRRVENEKQQAQRLASYAHLEEQERREPWLQLQMGLQVSSSLVCAACEASVQTGCHTRWSCATARLLDCLEVILPSLQALTAQKLRAW